MNLNVLRSSPVLFCVQKHQLAEVGEFIGAASVPDIVHHVFGGNAHRVLLKDKDSSKKFRYAIHIRWLCGYVVSCVFDVLLVFFFSLMSHRIISYDIALLVLIEFTGFFLRTSSITTTCTTCSDSFLVWMRLVGLDSK